VSTVKMAAVLIWPVTCISCWGYGGTELYLHTSYMC